MGGFLFEDEYDWAEELGTAWYRSKERVPISYAFLGGGALSSKKWPLIEESSTFSHYKLDSIIFLLDSYATPFDISTGEFHRLFIFKEYRI